MRKPPVSATVVRHTCAVIVLASNVTIATALSYDEGPSVNLGVVVITGTASVPDFGNVYVDQSAISWYGFANEPAFTRGWVSWDWWLSYKEMMETIAMASPASPDVRCNTFASAASRETTSQSDREVRWTAAQQIFYAINLYDQGRSLMANIRQSASIMDAFGTYRRSFSITYADGGKERWIVLPGLPPKIDLSVSKMDVQGDGQIKPCPNTTTG